ncbi:MAG: sensor histidine kinase [Nevskia sp.]|nr:sensor histidine kinase [Nevskia sp.]
MKTLSGRPPSLRRRFLALLLAPLLLLFGVGGFACYAFAVHYANATNDSWLYDSAASLALLIERADRGVVLDMPKEAQRMFEWDFDETMYYKVVGSRSGLIVQHGDIPPTPSNTFSYRQVQFFDTMVEGRAVRVAALQLPEAQYGEAVTVQVAETNGRRRKLEREILAGILLPQIVLIGAAGLIIWFGIHRGLAPLRLIAARLSAQDHRHPAPIPSHDVPAEVQPLTGALNELLGRLESTLAAQRRFVADAAHQLRTPLTSLKLNLDHALRLVQPAARTPLLEASRAVDRMARLSKQLLVLTRTEPNAYMATPTEIFDLVAVAAEVGAEWVPRAIAKDIDLGLSAPERRIEVRGNPVLFAEALHNLLDNAVKYHPGGGHISIQVGDQPSPFAIVVDDGPGIPAAQREDVLTRFYRLDRSGGDGNGLGLAIVREIVRAHDGRVTLSDNAGGQGLSVRIDLPAVPAVAAAA